MGADILISLSDFLGDLILIYRCWVIWNKNLWVVFLPFLTAAGGFGKFHLHYPSNGFWLTPDSRCHSLHHCRRALRLDAQSVFPGPSRSDRPARHGGIRPSARDQRDGDRTYRCEALAHREQGRETRWDAHARHREGRTTRSRDHRRERLALPRHAACIRGAIWARTPRAGDLGSHRGADLRKFRSSFSDVLSRLTQRCSQGIAPTLIIIQVALGIATEQTTALPRKSASMTPVTVASGRASSAQAHPPSFLPALSSATDDSTLRQDECLELKSLDLDFDDMEVAVAV